VSQLQVADINVPNLLRKLKSREWLTPQFQREFVWSNAAVIALVNSIIDARPVGMITLWEQQDRPALVLQPISIPDYDSNTGRTGERIYADADSVPGRYYAILDGKQRSTAIALAFGGLRAASGLYRHAGAYYLDVTARDENERVKFVTQKEITKRGIGTLSGAISSGLFPLSVDEPDNLMGQWMSYLQHIRNPDFYENGKLPDEDELDRRNRVLSSAFSGILNTKLAVYIVPNTYSLAEICDIFETLNTTGTKVSPVDLIHSGLFNDTVTDAGGPLLLRDEIDTLGELDGAVGWASSTDRPELIAQFVAASHVALDTKPEPKRTGGIRESKITSVKSGDLLAIPSVFWRRVFEQNATFASFIGGFQTTVAGGPFGMAQCPYPASAAIYVALRWFREFDSSPAIHWDIQHLDRLYRAFFWRNVLYSRYDQGFLTQIGADIRDMKDFLNSTTSSITFDEWTTRANLWLDGTIGPRPSFEEVFDIVSDGHEKGALRRAALLLLYARASQDIANTELNIGLGSGSLDLHHIYPRDWCANHAGGDLRLLLNAEAAGQDWITSAANLIPMHRRTNNEWRKMAPVAYLQEREVDYDSRQELWARYFVNRDAYEQLLRGEQGVEEFWRIRATLLAEEIMNRTVV